MTDELTIESALEHVVAVAKTLEDAALEYERAQESNASEHVRAEAKLVLDRARSANGTARFIASPFIKPADADDPCPYVYSVSGDRCSLQFDHEGEHDLS